jgi:8-oxo-dGTP pyrophosphatase MutT (NUDIX family)
VVVDETGRVLLIERWVKRGGLPVYEVRLPKGHVEPGESDEQAALREVCEEAGLCRLTAIADLGEYTTVFDSRDGLVMRLERYYLMRPGGDEIQPHTVDPDSEEARFRVHWYPTFDEAEKAITFESEQEFIRRARHALDGLTASGEAG